MQIQGKQAVHITVRLPVQLIQKLRAIAKRHDATRSETIRGLLEEAAEAHCQQDAEDALLRILTEAET